MDEPILMKIYVVAVNTEYMHRSGKFWSKIFQGR